MANDLSNRLLGRSLVANLCIRVSNRTDVSLGFVRAEVVEKTTKYQTQIPTENMTLLINDVELSIPQSTPAAYLAELIGALS